MAKSFWIAVRWIIRNTENKYLILSKSIEEEIDPDNFDLPGWSIKRWEKLQEALMREMNDEAGIQIQIEKFLSHRWFIQWNIHTVWMTFLASCKDREYLILSGKYASFRRKTKNEILNGKYPIWLKEEFKRV